MPSTTAWIDAALTGVAIQHSNMNSYITDSIAPRIPTTKQTGRVWRIDALESARKTASDFRAPGVLPTAVTYEFDNDITYRADCHALMKTVSDEEVSQADAELRPFITATQILRDRILTRREIALVAAIVAHFDGTKTDATSDWATAPSTATPIADIQAWINIAKGEDGLKVNAIAMDESVLRAISATDEFQNRVQSVLTPAQATGTVNAIGVQLMNMLQLTKIDIANVTMQNTAARGITAVMADVWGENVFLHRHDPTPGTTTAASVTQPIWNGLGGGTLDGMTVERARLDAGLSKAETVALYFYYDLLIMGDDTKGAPGFLGTAVLTA